MLFTEVIIETADAGRSLVIIGDFDVVSISIFPAEAGAPLWVVSDAQLAAPTAIEGFQAVGREIFRSSKYAFSAASFSAGSEGAKDFGRTTRASPGPGVNLPDKRSPLAGWPPTSCCSTGSPPEIHALSPSRPFPAS